MSDPRPKMKVPARLSGGELAQLAVDVAEGRVYMTNSEEGVRTSFGLLIAMLDWDDVAEQVGALYEWLNKAMPRGINGLPMFTSMQTLHVDDLQPLIDKIEKYESARADFVEGAA